MNGIKDQTLEELKSRWNNGELVMDSEEYKNVSRETRLNVENKMQAILNEIRRKSI